MILVDVAPLLSFINISSQTNSLQGYRAQEMIDWEQSSFFHMDFDRICMEYNFVRDYWFIQVMPKMLRVLI